MVVGDSQQETLDPSFVLFTIDQQDLSVILRELMLPNGFNPVSTGFIVRDVPPEEPFYDVRNREAKTPFIPQTALKITD
ncbi:unnamed protein product [Schistosoma margrebowiei]|uniref:Uncharacterized protein n=1 Tax=Schistosoma margrebowiei TaxID=48269 RepID=A0A183L904_9TREM|nr:unnamed protein product [Schistosoma margrebowiei]